MTNSPFDFVSAASYTKQNLMRDGLRDESEYNAWLTNRALSYHIDSILYANELNQRPDADSLCQFEYLLNTLPRKKRFAKWIKPDRDERLEAIMECLNYNRERATEALSILSDNQVAMIQSKVSKGGLNHERKTDRGPD